MIHSLSQRSPSWFFKQVPPLRQLLVKHVSTTLSQFLPEKPTRHEQVYFDSCSYRGVHSPLFKQGDFKQALAIR